MKEQGNPKEAIINVPATAGGINVVTPNGARKVLMLQNISDTSITIRFDGSDPVSNAGYVLAAGAMVIFSHNFIPTNLVKAIHGSTGTKALYVMEL